VSGVDLTQQPIFKVQHAMPDLEEAPTCQEWDGLTGLVCSNTAAWRLRVLHPEGTHCVTTLVCAPHRLRIIEAAARSIQKGNLLRCVRHNILRVQIVWIAL
jgi:hypothetical protein